MNDTNYKDYHIHSYYSDGELSPKQIVDRWFEKGYKLISITDHDGIDGSIEGYEYVKANNIDIQLIPGIEFDSEDELAPEIHILGYGFDYKNAELKDALSKVTIWRAVRNDKIHKVIKDLGYDVSLDDLEAVNGGRYTGKPTFAQALINKGYFKSISEVFDKLLDANEDIDSIKKEKLSSKEVIDVIHAAGGIAIMAHPMEYIRKDENIEEYMPSLVQLMGKMVEYGIDGIECVHPSATHIETLWLEECAKKNNLVMTNGSDFHSDKNVRIYK